MTMRPIVTPKARSGVNGIPIFSFECFPVGLDEPEPAAATAIFCSPDPFPIALADPPSILTVPLFLTRYSVDYCGPNDRDRHPFLVTAFVSSVYRSAGEVSAFPRSISIIPIGDPPRSIPPRLQSRRKPLCQLRGGHRRFVLRPLERVQHVGFESPSG